MQLINPWFRRGGILAAGLLLCSGLVATPAMAASITYNFTGDVTRVDPLVSPRFDNSMTMKGSMTVDMVDQDPGDSSSGLYGVQSFTVTIGGYTATLGPSLAGSTQFVNDSPFLNGLDGVFALMEELNGANENFNGNFLGPRLFGIALVGPRNLLVSDALPDSVPSVSSFADLNEFRLAFGPDGVAGGVSGVVTSLTAVPLPAAVLLFGAGLISLVGLGAGGLRNLRGAKT
jgi:hypothetical protein